MTQYFDTMRDLAQSARSAHLFLPHHVGAVREVCDTLRAGVFADPSGASDGA